MCGSLSCSSSTGLFCDATKGVSGQCAKSVKGPWIVVKRKGQCEDVPGLLSITDPTKCSEAASTIGKDIGMPSEYTHNAAKTPKGMLKFLVLFQVLYTFDLLWNLQFIFFFFF